MKSAGRTEMKTTLVWIAALVVTSTAIVAAQGGQKDAPQVDGTWTMSVEGPAAHGSMTATLVLTQTGAKVAGSLTAHGNEHTLAGELADGALTLETTDTPADHVITLNATLQGDGTLSGYLSGPMGDMKWTASRAKDSR
jgi:hypothetical protein